MVIWLPRVIETTVGRVIFNQATPKTVPFVNQLMTKKNLKTVIADTSKRQILQKPQSFWIDIKDLGFFWAYKGGLSFNLGDLITPSIKEQTLD
jgi:DNA-directed RNA polymerase subunit beta'